MIDRTMDEGAKNEEAAAILREINEVLRGADSREADLLRDSRKARVRALSNGGGFHLQAMTRHEVDGIFNFAHALLQISPEGRVVGVADESMTNEGRDFDFDRSDIFASEKAESPGDDDVRRARMMLEEMAGDGDPSSVPLKYGNLFRLYGDRVAALLEGKEERVIPVILSDKRRVSIRKVSGAAGFTTVIRVTSAPEKRGNPEKPYLFYHRLFKLDSAGQCSYMVGHATSTSATEEPTTYEPSMDSQLPPHGFMDELEEVISGAEEACGLSRKESEDEQDDVWQAQMQIEELQDRIETLRALYAQANAL